MKRDRKSGKAAFERLLNSVHETHIVFENLSNINRDMLQKAWGLNIGEDGTYDLSCSFYSYTIPGSQGPLLSFYLHENQVSE